MLRDEGPLTPIAGCTDVYVGPAVRDAARPPLHRSVADRRAARDHATTVDPAHRRADDVFRADRVALVRRQLPMLVAAAREVGGRQIQNRGTLGGNIANASPAGDSLPVLAAADATSSCRARTAERRVPFTAFYTGYRASVRRADELIAAIEIPRVEGKQYWRKVGTRRAQAISKVMCAAVRGPVSRVALGSVAPTVIRLPRTEQVLSAGGSLEEAQAALAPRSRPSTTSARPPPIGGRSAPTCSRLLAGDELRPLMRAALIVTLFDRPGRDRHDPVAAPIDALVEALRPALPFPAADDGAMPAERRRRVQVVRRLAGRSRRHVGDREGQSAASGHAESRRDGRGSDSGGDRSGRTQGAGRVRARARRN